jgi:hypothetical protein
MIKFDVIRPENAGKTTEITNAFARADLGTYGS